MNKDYRLKITIRNDRILSKMESLGYISVMKFCKEFNLDYQRTTEIINGKLKPFNSKGTIIKICDQLLAILGLELHDAFTDRQLQGFNKTGFMFKLKEKEMLELVDPVQNQEIKVIENDVQKKIADAMDKRLSPKQKEMLSLKYGFNGHIEHTLDEIGKQFSVSKERVRQIIAKSERMLKHPTVMNDIINTGFVDIFTKVNISRKRIKEAEDKEAEDKIA
jgi:RNA polymerase sigma factor (sigma-70 family)|tara:strand:+ start:288 stop:947 length:660 start_codon:yes stop_codon:yes gene_type:complete